MNRAKVGFIVERRYLRQEMPEAVIRTLQSRGVAADVICPQGAFFDPETSVVRTQGGTTTNLSGYDLIVSRNRNGLGLAMLAYADAAGIPAVNTHASTQRVRNKAKMAIALSQAGLPCAPTVLAADASVLAALPEHWFPLILKATYGDNSQGLRLIRRPADLGDLHWSESLVLAQHYVPNEGFDLKLYVCGQRVFAMHKPSPFNRDPQASPRPAPLSGCMVDLALRCGQTFGLDLYGVDAIETADGPVVIEVNEFPNFTGVAGAAEHIADYILGRATQGKRNETRVHPAELHA